MLAALLNQARRQISSYAISGKPRPRNEKRITGYSAYKYETYIRINSLPTPRLFEFKKEEANETFRLKSLHTKAIRC